MIERVPTAQRECCTGQHEEEDEDYYGRQQVDRGVELGVAPREDEEEKHILGRHRI